LQTQARQFAAGGKDAENLLVFARLLRLAELPKEIGEAKDIIRRVNQAQRQFENFQEWLGETGPTRRMDIGFGSLQQLAVRRDLAVLDQAKVGRMCSELPTLNCFGTTGVT
jgi:hypothetical protein